MLCQIESIETVKVKTRVDDHKDSRYADADETKRRANANKSSPVSGKPHSMPYKAENGVVGLQDPQPEKEDDDDDDEYYYNDDEGDDYADVDDNDDKDDADDQDADDKDDDNDEDDKDDDNNAAAVLDV